MEVLALLLLLACSLSSRALVLPHEPTAVIKSRLAPSDPTLVEEWRQLRDSDNEEALGRVEAAILSTFTEKAAFFVATEGRLKVEHFPKGMKPDSSLLLPGPNALSLLSTSINIIFDGFKPEIMTKKLGDLMRSKDKKKVKGFESFSLLDLVSSRVDRNEDTFNELDARCRVFVDVANSLLGKTALEAWRDTFLSLGLDNSMFSGYNIITSSHDLLIFTKLILSELQAVKPAVDVDMEGQFAFGWWLNCNSKRECLIPVLPSNTIFTLTPGFRMYMLLDIGVAVVIIDNLPDTDKNNQPKLTFTQELHKDVHLWGKVRKAISDTQGEDVESETKDEFKSEVEEESQIEDKSPSRDESPAKDKLQVKEKPEDKKQLPSKDRSHADDKSKSNDKSQATDELQAKDKSQSTDKFQMNDKLQDDSSLEDDDGLVLPEPMQCVVDILWSGLSAYMEFTSKQHTFVRGILWLLFLGVAHVVVYWGVHLTWLILGFIFPRIHLHRPKSTKVD